MELTVTHLVKEFPPALLSYLNFHYRQYFSLLGWDPVLKTDLTDPYREPFESSLPPFTVILILSPHLRLVLSTGLFLSLFRQTISCSYLSLPCVLYVPPVVSSLIYRPNNVLWIVFSVSPCRYSIRAARLPVLVRMLALLAQRTRQQCAVSLLAFSPDM
jgi:hypothetical protein